MYFLGNRIFPNVKITLKLPREAEVSLLYLQLFAVTRSHARFDPSLSLTKKKKRYKLYVNDK